MAEEKVKKVGLFDFLNDLTSNKEYLLKEDTEKEFNVFMINRGMGQQPDLILLANEMNKSPGLTKEMVHDFYFYAVKKKKRYGSWSKADNGNKEILDLIVRHYVVNRTVAESYLKLMTPDDINSLKEKYEVGGRSK